MHISLDGKVAVISGGNRGIGLGIAKKLGCAGATVVLLARDEIKLNESTELLKNEGIKAISYPVDLQNSSIIDDTIKKVLATCNQIDILINNAGVTRDTLLMRMTEDDWTSVISTNLTGTFNLTKAVIRSMIKNRSGKIINITSVVGIMGNAGQANYAASKAGIIGFTKSVAREVAGRNVTVNAVAPGFIETEMTNHLQPEQKEKYLSNIPLTRFGTTDDVANVVLFLSSKLSDYMTGQVVVVDGGMVM